MMDPVQIVDPDEQENATAATDSELSAAVEANIETEEAKEEALGQDEGKHQHHHHQNQQQQQQQQQQAQEHENKKRREEWERMRERQHERERWNHESRKKSDNFDVMGKLRAKIRALDSDQWPDLPICAHRHEIVKKILENQVIIVTGETGSGKTTQIPQFLAALPQFKGMIGCTQPRRVACISVARRVASEIGCETGDEVGYAIRFDDCTSEKTGIKYMTDGVLLRECLTDRQLRKYDVVLLDEAHERSLHTDVLFGLMKQVCVARPNFKLMITSATLDTEKFSKFFFDAPVMQVPGRSFPVEIRYHTGTWGERGYLNPMLDLVVQIHVREPPEKHILLFLTGQDEIDRACKGVHEKVMKLVNAGLYVPGLRVCPLHSELPADFYNRVFDDVPANTRKLVVATNIAETSVTVSGVSYVIDCGYVKQKVYNAGNGMEALEVVNISKMAATQRAGRAGRTGPGICIRLYGQTRYEKDFANETVPEILRTNLCSVVLNLKGLGIHDVLNFDFLDPPPQDALVAAHRMLYLLGAIDADGHITRHGHDMVKFPLEPTVAKMLLISAELRCSEEILTIASCMSAEGGMFYRPTDEEEKKLADLRKNDFLHPDGDGASMLMIFNSWKRGGGSIHWCKANYMHYRALRRSADIREQLRVIMEKMNLPIVHSKSLATVNECIAKALYMNAARRSIREGYVLVDDGRMVTISGGSMLCASGDDEWPDIVVAHELVWAKGGQLRFICAAQLEWIRPLLPMLKKVDLNRLCGSARKRDASAMGASSNDGSGDAAAAAAEDEESKKQQQERDEKANAAKARFLARKKAKDQ